MESFGSTLGQIKKARAIGETKVDKSGKTLVWTMTPKGVLDWRIQSGAPVAKPSENTKSDSGDETPEGGNKYGLPDKTMQFLGTTSSDILRQFANKPGNKPALRQAAYDELVNRKEDVDDIDMNSGVLGAQKQFFGSEDDTDFTFNIPDATLVPPAIWDKVKQIFPDGDIDYKNDKLIKNVFNGLSTKAERIKYDNFVDEVKRSDEFYMSPKEEIHDMNKQIAGFIQNKSPFMMISGGAGVGKSYNFKGVAGVMQKRQFDPSTDSPGDGDYDYVEVGEVSSAGQLIELLRKHNGKTILFDDADTGLFRKDCLNVLKKATNPSGVRYIGKESGDDAGTFAFEGQIVVLTNKGQNELTADPDRLAVYTRALKRDIYFTKREQLEFMTPLIHKFEFDDVKRLDNAQDDMEERDSILELMVENFDRIDPVKMNSRFMRELIQEKRDESVADGITQKNASAASFFGGGSDWKRKLTQKLVKGNSIKMGVKEALEVLKLNTND